MRAGTISHGIAITWHRWMRVFVVVLARGYHRGCRVAAVAVHDSNQRCVFLAIAAIPSIPVGTCWAGVVWRRVSSHPRDEGARGFSW